MKITIWGARGSHPHPMTPAKFRSRVQSIIQRIGPEDISSNENRERFLGSLPEWLWRLPGGNTPCIEVRLSDNSCIILDAGSGIIPMSRQLFAEENAPKTFHLFFSHFHYDHIQGLPFFSQAYIPSTEMHFYSPERDVQFVLQEHMHHPYFPVKMEERMTPAQHFHHLKHGPGGSRRLKIGDATIDWLPINHPGNAYSYKITENGKSFIYATDFEISGDDFEKTEANSAYFTGADVLMLDTMYTLGEAIEKFNWGHSSFSIGVDFAHAWDTKRLLLFHHEPQYDDQRLYGNLRNARWYAERQNYPGLAIDIAEEGMEIEL